MNSTTHSVKILYFAGLAEALSCKEESVSITANTKLSELKKQLVLRGEIWKKLNNQNTKCAINQNIISQNFATQTSTNTDPVLNNGDEIAFFPPVTGG